MRTLTLPTLAAAMALQTACGASAEFSRRGGFDQADTGWAGAPGEDADGNGGVDTATPDLIPIGNTIRPEASRQYVFIANPERDSVTRIDAASREVRTAPVGRYPRLVRTTPSGLTAVVLNLVDASVTLLDADTLRGPTVTVRSNVNQFAISPDGGAAVLWYDEGARRDSDPSPGGAVSFNEVGIVSIATGVFTPVVVGFNPSRVRFDAAGDVAVVAADASLAVINLRDPSARPTFIPIADPLDPPRADDIALSRSGAFAYIRQQGETDIAVVDIIARSVDYLAIGADLTDLQLSPDGSRGVVLSRGDRKLVLFDAEDPFGPGDEVALPADGPAFSRLLFDREDQGILYAGGTGASRLGIWSTLDGEIQPIALRKPATAIGRARGADTLLVVHPTANNPDGSTPSYLRDRHAVSLIDLIDGRPNSIAFDAPPLDVSHSPDGLYGYVILDGLPFLEVLDYASLLHHEIRLRSTPVFVGVLPDLDPDDGVPPDAWVSQEHELGRLSFYAPTSGALQTITGFELNAAIED